MADLVFKDPPGATLVFNSGIAGGGSASNATITIEGLIGELSGNIFVGPHLGVLVAGLIGELSGDIALRYASDTARPTVGDVRSHWQLARPTEVGVETTDQFSVRLQSWTVARSQAATCLSSETSVRWANSLHVNVLRHARFQQGIAQGDLLNGAFANATHTRTATTGRFQRGAPTERSLDVAFQQAIRTEMLRASRFQRGLPLETGHLDSARDAQRSGFVQGLRFQNAIRPPGGRYVHPVASAVEPCYVPNANLVFTDPWRGLVFICERHTTPLVPGATTVVPVQRVYIVINNASLRRVDGNIQLPVFNMSLSLDADSWAWSFSAALPGSTLSSIEPSEAGVPVEVEAMINGVPYRALIERVSRERSFGKSDIRVSGRGKTALLDSPYAPSRNFINSSARTAQQLMGDVLSVNGVPMDWTLDWQLTDWAVPAGVFAHQGSYISAVNAISAAAGGYVQPHASMQTLHILPRYPTAPWDWDSVTPDFVLPSAVTSRESIEWVERARYNRVFVSGQQSGVLGQVTRTGTAGDLLAPMVTDALITTAAAARQRGLSILANTGRQAEISLRLPVLAETGVITPGKFVQYLDGGVSRMGIVRSTGVEVGMPEIWQTLGVQTYA